MVKGNNPLVDVKVHLEDVIEMVRREERERAVDIVRGWEIYSPYIVGKLRIDDRKQKIIEAIRGDYVEDDYSGA
jgi:hypothetical protein